MVGIHLSQPSHTCLRQTTALGDSNPGIAAQTSGCRHLRGLDGMTGIIVPPASAPNPRIRVEVDPPRRAQEPPRFPGSRSKRGFYAARMNRPQRFRGAVFDPPASAQKKFPGSLDGKIPTKNFFSPGDSQAPIRVPNVPFPAGGARPDPIPGRLGRQFHSPPTLYEKKFRAFVALNQPPFFFLRPSHTPPTPFPDQPNTTVRQCAATSFPAPPVITTTSPPAPPSQRLAGPSPSTARSPRVAVR